LPVVVTGNVKLLGLGQKDSAFYTGKSGKTFINKDIKKGIWDGKEIEYVDGEILIKPRLGISL
jgi:hypothetical protein